MPRSIKKTRVPPLPDVVKQHSNGHHHEHEPSLPQLEDRYSQTITKTDVEEVWFAGAHCGMSISLYSDHWQRTYHHADVGGGSVVNGTRNSLARIPLRWMIRQCFDANTGIMFHRSMFKQIGMDPATLYPHVLDRPQAIYQTPPPPSPPGTPDSTKAYYVPPPEVINNDPTIVAYSDGGSFVSEEQEDLADALSPVYDQLQIVAGWWTLEVIPQKLHYQRDEDDRWENNFV